MLLLYVITFSSFLTVALSQSATVCDDERLYTFIPDVRDCSSWFFCGVQGPVQGNCLNGHLFNPETRLCDWSDNVNCYRCPNNVGLQKIPIMGSCRSFIRCIGGNPAQQVCESGLQFNENTGQCDLSSVVGCTSGFRCPAELPIDGSIVAMRDNYNCSVYHLCVGGPEAIRQECNPDLHFDPVTKLCTFPNLTSCPI
ncbi:Peritrophin-1, partial [Pseudolycoriella hygida]